MADLQNVKRGRLFRELVASRLQLAGLDATAAPPCPRRSLADAMADDTPQTGDIVVPGWSIQTSAALNLRDLGATLDAAAQIADLAGRGDIAVVVSYRRSRGVSEAIVSMSLDSFGRVAARMDGVDV
jgi:hypothetical protein